MCTAMELEPQPQDMPPQPLFKQESKEEEKIRIVDDIDFGGKQHADVKPFFTEAQYAPNVQLNFGGKPLIPQHEMAIKKVMQSTNAKEYHNGDKDNQRIIVYNLSPLVDQILNEAYFQRYSKKIVSLPGFTYVRTALIEDPSKLNQLLNERKVQDAAAKHQEIKQILKDSLSTEEEFLDLMASKPIVQRKVVGNLINAMNDRAMRPKIEYDTETRDNLGQLFRHPTVYIESRNFQPAHKRHFYISMGLAGGLCYILGRNSFGKEYLDKAGNMIFKFFENRLKTPA